MPLFKVIINESHTRAYFIEPETAELAKELAENEPIIDFENQCERWDDIESYWNIEDVSEVKDHPTVL